MAGNELLDGGEVRFVGPCRRGGEEVVGTGGAGLLDGPEGRGHHGVVWCGG